MSTSLTGIWEKAVDSYQRAIEGVRQTSSQALDFVQRRKNSQRILRPVHFERAAPSIPESRRVYAVGDVHGRADLLEKLLLELRSDASEGGFEGRPILVMLGDYIDRGFQSREVLDILLGEDVSPFETYFLKGNHEAAMLQFLDDPKVGPRWAEYGGVETLVSYGVQPPRTRTNTDDWQRACEELRRVMPDAHRHFLANLELSVRIGGYVFVHAGLRPGVPLEEQTERDLLWIREEFLEDRRPFDTVVVHGHTPTTNPFRDSRRIGLDTGAYLSGKLTAARFEGESVGFLTAGTSRVTNLSKVG